MSLHRAARSRAYCVYNVYVRIYIRNEDELKRRRGLRFIGREKRADDQSQKEAKRREKEREKERDVHADVSSSDGSSYYYVFSRRFSCVLYVRFV